MKRRLHAAHPSVPSPATSPPNPGSNLYHSCRGCSRHGPQQGAEPCMPTLFAGVTGKNICAPNDSRYFPTAPCCSRMLATSTVVAMAMHRRRWLRVGAESRKPGNGGASCLLAQAETCLHGLGRSGLVLACSRHTGVGELQMLALFWAHCAKVATMTPAVRSLAMQSIHDSFIGSRSFRRVRIR